MINCRVNYQTRTTKSDTKQKLPYPLIHSELQHRSIYNSMVTDSKTD